MSFKEWKEENAADIDQAEHAECPDLSDLLERAYTAGVVDEIIWEIMMLLRVTQHSSIR